MARDGLDYIEQGDFRAGAWPQFDRVPSNGLQDIVDGLVMPDGLLLQRGGSAVKSNADTGSDIVGLWDGFLTPGRRTAIATTGGLLALAADDVSPVDLLGGVTDPFGPGRFVEIGRMLMRMRSDTTPGGWLWGGALTQTSIDAPAGSVQFTRGSKTVVGVGTAFGSTYQQGAIIHTGNAARLLPAVIDSVQSSSSLTLADPWPYPGQTIASGWKVARALLRDFSASGIGAPLAGGRRAIATQIFGRLILAQGNRIFPSDFGIDDDGNQWATLMEFNALEESVSLPEGVIVTGMEALRDQLLVFTTAGVWVLYGLAQADVTDFSGNPSWQLEQVTRDVVLWGDAGIASYRSALVVPAVDELYLFESAGAPQPITGGGKNLYRSYMAAGYQPGQAGVFRGHYMLPILNGTTVVDQLVWRLDLEGVPFVRWSGHGGQSRAYAQRIGEASRSPRLLSATAKRVTDSSAVFEPSASTDHDGDGSSVQLSLTTGPARMPEMLEATWRRLRARLEVENQETFSVAADVSVNDGAFVGLSAGQVKQDGDEYVASWPHTRRARSIRYRVRMVGSAGRVAVRALRLGARSSGKPRP